MRGTQPAVTSGAIPGVVGFALVSRSEGRHLASRRKPGPGRSGFPLTVRLLDLREVGGSRMYRAIRGPRGWVSTKGGDAPGVS